MKFSPDRLIAAARDTLLDPASAAQQVIALRLSVAEGVMAVALTAAVATILTALLQMVLGPVGDPEMQNLFSHPFALFGSQCGVMLVGAALMSEVGRLFGGRGTFAGALSLVAWAEVVLILLQLAEIVLLLAFPVLAVPVGVGSLFAFFFLLTHFVAALNGFTSLIKTFFGIIATTVGVLLLVSFLLMLIIPVPNV